jgi:hypothetical protein
MRDIEFSGDSSYAHYGELVDSMEYEVLVEVSDSDYQGDSRYLLRDGIRYGILVFGWGSCSGCDALEACDTRAEVVELRDGLHEDIRWFDTETSIVEWLCSPDRDGEYSIHVAEGGQFLREAMTHLGADLALLQNKALPSSWRKARDAAEKYSS